MNEQKIHYDKMPKYKWQKKTNTWKKETQLCISLVSLKKNQTVQGATTTICLKNSIQTQAARENAIRNEMSIQPSNSQMTNATKTTLSPNICWIHIQLGFDLVARF